MKGSTPKLHRFRGTWMTVAQIAEITGLKPRTVYRRIQFRLSIDEPHRMGPRPKRYEFRGELKTAAEIMAITGLSRSQVGKRTDGVRFFDLDEATDPYADLHPNCRVITYRGTKDSIAGWARRTGIPHYVLRERILSMKWPLKRALTEPVMSPSQRRRYHRNAEIIRRIASVFQTGGYERTFRDPMGTGAGRREFHFDRSEVL